MAVLETHAIGGGAQLTLLSAVGGDPDEGGGRFRGLGERGYNEEAKKQGEMRGHLSSKADCRDANNPVRHPPVNGATNY